jgi:hypothetical protein
MLGVQAPAGNEVIAEEPTEEVVPTGPQAKERKLKAITDGEAAEQTAEDINITIHDNISNVPTTSSLPNANHHQDENLPVTRVRAQMNVCGQEQHEAQGATGEINHFSNHNNNQTNNENINNRRVVGLGAGDVHLAFFSRLQRHRGRRGFSTTSGLLCGRAFSHYHFSPCTCQSKQQQHRKFPSIRAQ